MPARDLKPNRTRRHDGNGKDAIVAGALRTFYQRGYFGTSIRDIAAEADMTSASLYHHFSDKQEILRVVMVTVMQDALETTRASLLSAGTLPHEQLGELMRAWVQFHSDRQIEAMVGASELRSLDDPGRQVVVALRDEQEGMFVEVIRRGTDEGTFLTPDPREAARAIINMGTAVATWYRPDGDLAAAEVANTYVRLALSTVQSTQAL